MRYLIVDDETAARKDLMRALSNVAKDSEMIEAANAEEAIEFCKTERFDVVFMDIQLPDMDGISTAKDMIEACPGLNIVIQTANPQYALEAYGIYVSDFIVKPVAEQDVRSALDHLRWPVSGTSRKLEARCFGLFDVIWDDKPLKFDRRKTKELLAYLIDCNGKMVSTENIAAALWEDEDDICNAKQYTRVLVNDLRKTLNMIGMGDLIIRRYGEIGIRKDLLDCDYYRLMDGDENISYRGEYMMQYSWAEDTAGILSQSIGV